MTIWRAPLALVALITFPLVAGTLRLVELGGGPVLLPTNPRIDASPIPLVVHVLAAAAYGIGGAFQFSARLRRRQLVWHRRTGRILVGAGLVVAGSGLWMTLCYVDAPGGGLLWFVRLVVVSVMAACLVLGVAAVRRRDVRAHRAWMIRAYALGVAAGTQVITQGVGEAAFGTSNLSTALSVSAGWIVNIVAAELIIRRPVVGRTTTHRERRAGAAMGES